MNYRYRLTPTGVLTRFTLGTITLSKDWCYLDTPLDVSSIEGLVEGQQAETLQDLAARKGTPILPVRTSTNSVSVIEQLLNEVSSPSTEAPQSEEAQTLMNIDAQLPEEEDGDS